jgi:ubiquinone/menaquinone biosynthesis C-methylase UbiE
MSAYIADQTWPDEARRLNALERALDESTCRHLVRVGVSAGMRCLEIGAGSGSIARWFSRTVGPTGQVTATDLDTTLLEALPGECANVRVLREDISESVRLVGEGFDVVHARLVLGHVAQPERALTNIIQVLRKGGVALIEDADFLWSDVGEQPLYPASAALAYFPVWRAAVDYMHRRGYAVHWGRQLAAAMRSAGFEDVSGEAVILIGDRALQGSMALTIKRFAPALLQEGSVDQSAIDACLAALEDHPGTTFTGSPVFSVRGRRSR